MRHTVGTSMLTEDASVMYVGRRRIGMRDIYAHVLHAKVDSV